MVKKRKAEPEEKLPDKRLNIQLTTEEDQNLLKEMKIRAVNLGISLKEYVLGLLHKLHAK